MAEQFKIGDVVWVGRAGPRQIEQPCDTCFGKRKLTLILGNSGAVTIPCGACGDILGWPTGRMKVWTTEPHAECHIVSGVQIAQAASGETREYMSGCFVLHEDNVFRTEAEALARATELAENERREQRRRAAWLKQTEHKDYGWNAAYHRREAKRCRKQAETHDLKAQLCQERAKSPLDADGEA